MTNTKIFSLTNVFRLHAILAGLYAILLIVFPIQAIQLLSDIVLSETAADITRLFGAAMVLITYLTWQTSTSNNPEIQQLVARTLFLYTTLGLIISLWGQIVGNWAITGWSNVGTYLIFVLGYGYFLFLHKE